MGILRAFRMSIEAVQAGDSCVLDMLNTLLRDVCQGAAGEPISVSEMKGIVDQVNAFGEEQIRDGLLAGFRCWYDVHRNSARSLKRGNLVLSYSLTLPINTSQQGPAATIDGTFQLAFSRAA